MASKTFVNPRPESVQLVLSDGSRRVVGPWGVAIVPPRAEDGRPVEVVSAEIVAFDLASTQVRRHEHQGRLVLE